MAPCSAPASGYIPMQSGQKIREPADYLLVLYLDRNLLVEVGRLGKIRFQMGSYIYSGSARGGLWGRVKRHLGRPIKKRWHIDHLTSLPISRSVWWRPHRKNGECIAASILSERYHPIDGFGCSDCRCGSHLFFMGPERSFLHGHIEEGIDRK